MSRHEKHPVDDFLFEYYSYRPAQLARWHPGTGSVLENGGEFLDQKYYTQVPGGVAADPALMSPGRQDAVRWIRGLLAATAGRPAGTGCFGLHEWAMIYRASDIRHSSWPLRVDAAVLEETVESLGPRCTHYDAFRFFTPAARPLNRFELQRSTSPEFEQPGCLHANMDLYKWAIKLAPFSPSELVADAFALAREIRTLDMRASPYDFSTLGLSPVCIETPEGRAEYESAQRAFAAEAAPIRERIIAVCDQILEILRVRTEEPV